MRLIGAMCIAAAPSFRDNERLRMVTWQAYNNLGVLQRDVGAMMDALAAYDKCLEIAPESRNAGAFLDFKHSEIYIFFDSK